MGFQVTLPSAERLGQKITWGPDFSDFEVMMETGLFFRHHFDLHLLILVHGYIIRS